MVSKFKYALLSAQGCLSAYVSIYVLEVYLETSIRMFVDTQL